MDKTKFITFSTPSHFKFQEEFNRLYSKDLEILNYTSNQLETSDFYLQNQQIFKYKKYFGYFLWKPYIILETFKNNLDIDNVIYCDSNIRFKNIKGFLNEAYKWLNNNGTLLVKHFPHINKQWTKRDTFVYMNADNEKYWNAHQVWTVLLGFNKDKKNLLEEYLFYCKNPNIVTELPNICGLENLPEFREHRWEQSVLSILAEKFNIAGPWDLDMFQYYDKIYDIELYKLKEEINKNPLAEIK